MFGWVTRRLGIGAGKGQGKAAGGVDVRACARVLIAGPTGVGKSTLINAVVGAPVARMGAGAPITQDATWHRHRKAPVAFCDTRGLELADGEQQVAALRAVIGGAANPQRPHAAWLCVSEQAHRLFLDGRGSEGGVLRLLAAADIPAILVVTKAEPAGAGPSTLGLDRDAEVLRRLTVAHVCVEPLLTSDGRVAIPAHGLPALKRATVALLPDTLRPALLKRWVQG